MNKLFLFRSGKFQQSNNFKNCVCYIQYEKGEHKRNSIFLVCKDITKQNSHKKQQFGKGSKQKAVYKAGKFLFAAFTKVIINNGGSRKKERK